MPRSPAKPSPSAPPRAGEFSFVYGSAGERAATGAEGSDSPTPVAGGGATDAASGPAPKAATAGATDATGATGATDATTATAPFPPPGARVFIVVDGTHALFRAYHALPPLSTRRGVPVGAVYGLTSMLLRMLREGRPDAIAVCFDPEGPTFRNALFADYKAHRPPPPEDLVPQFALAREVVRAMGIPLVEVTGFEADDAIATLARRASAAGWHTLIAAGDKDFGQLVDDRTRIWDTMKNVRIGPDEVRARWGVDPAHMIDLQALIGDSVDNIPGVPGVGEKTAAKLLQQFGSLDALLGNPDAAPGAKLREKLREFADRVRANRPLVTLHTSVPVDVDLEALRVRPPDRALVTRLFSDLEFGSLLQQLAPAEALSRDGYRLITTAEALEQIVAELRAARRFAFDCETTGLDPRQVELVGISVAAVPGQAAYIPVGHRYLGCPAQLPRSVVLEALRPLLTDPAIELVGQNLKYDLEVFESACGIAFANVAFDTMLASYVLEPERRSHKLDALALDLLGHQGIAFGDVAGRGRKQVTFDQVPLEEALAYAGEDADLALRVSQLLHAQIESAGFHDLYYGLELPLLHVLARMEQAGILLDVPLLRAFSKRLESDLFQLDERIRRLAGSPDFNPASPKQLAAILFDKLGLKPLHRTKTGPSTDEETLIKLASEHELPAEILNFRKLQKLKSTYVDALPEAVNPKTGRVHTSFSQAVAATGRLSSSDPNLQNIPIRTELGREIRRAFIAPPGHVLLSADYSQIELRLLAHLSGDAELRRAFASGEDVHRYTASLVFGVPLADVDGEMRRRAKAVNFGVVYGQSAFRLGESLGIPTDEAQKFIDQYFERYAGVKRWLDDTLVHAQKTGEVSTLLGRRRRLADINSQNRTVRGQAERMAINTPVQGGAADLIKLAMLDIDRWLQTEPVVDGARTRMLLQVHDELVFEVPEAALERVRGEVITRMTDVRPGGKPLEVPLRVDVGVGPNWDEAH